MSEIKGVDVYLMDKLRHTNPKLAKKMRQRNNGGKYAQATYLAERGIDVGTMATGTTQDMKRRVQIEQPVDGGAPDMRRLAMDVGPETWKRFTSAKGDRTNPATVKMLLDAYERPVPMQANVTTEVANILKDYQGKLGTAGQLETMQKLCGRVESAEALRRKADELIEVVKGQERDIAYQRDQVTILKETVQGQQARIEEQTEEYESLNTAFRKAVDAQKATAEEMRAVRAVQTTPAPNAVLTRANAEGILFDFVSAFAGATMTADASGAMKVTLPDATPFFGIWQRAVTALGIGGKEGA